MTKAALLRHRRRQQDRWLATYLKLGSLRATEAAVRPKISRTRHCEWMRDDPEYAERFKAAEQSYIEKLEREADRRGAEGVLKPVYYKGEVVGHIREYSDVLLMFRLNGLYPQRYRQRFEHSGPNGGPIPIASLDLTRLTDEELGMMERVLVKFAPQAAGPNGHRALAAGDGA